MSPTLLFTFVIGYFLMLLGVAWYTSRNSNNDWFFIGNKSSNWMIVAFGMIGTSLSGVTFVSVPGAVGRDAFTYFQVVIGYLIGYLIIALVLLPLYYRLNLTSIYNYLSSRLGFKSYKTGVRRGRRGAARFPGGLQFGLDGCRRAADSGPGQDRVHLARSQQATGIIPNNLLEQAFHVAKRVRTETGIAAAAVSISSVAVELARKIFGDLEGRTVLILGAGEMAELALRHLVDDGVRSILVANRSHDRAVALAEQFHGRAVTFDTFHQEMLEADIVISSTSAPHLILKKEDVQAIILERRHRPIFLIDIANPRDIDPGCNDVDNVYLYNIDDLQAVVQANRAERQREAEGAEAIVQRDVGLFLVWLRGLDAEFVQFIPKSDVHDERSRLHCAVYCCYQATSLSGERDWIFGEALPAGLILSSPEGSSERTSS